MASTSPNDEQERIQPTSLIGRDEMNLAEFPIALLTDRASKGQKTLYFEDRHGKLTVTGSDAYGLPTAIDTDVIVALIYLTKQRTNFDDKKVNFSRYELIQLLNWPDDGKSYKRLDQSFNRWSGVLLVYEKCWWNNKLKCYTDAKMHIIDNIEIVDNISSRKARLDGQVGLPFSHFTWNRKFIESCQADNLRQLDLDTYFSLRIAISKRLYRFLGKRFYVQHDWTFDLDEIAFERVGLSRTYADAYKIKEKLQPAIDELEAIGFLRPLSRDDRFRQIDRGQWTIRLVRKSPALVAPKPESPPVAEPPLVAELTGRGVTRATAIELVRTHDAARITTQMEHLDWLTDKKPGKIADSAAWLVSAIRIDNAPPKGFISKAERQRQDEVKREKERQTAEARRAKREKADAERAEQQAIAAHWEGLTKPEQEKLMAQAIAQADAEMLAMTKGSMRKFGMKILRDQHIRKLLREQDEREPA